MTKSDHIQNFLAATRKSLTGGTFVRISLGNYKGADVTLKKIAVKKIVIKGQEKLSFTYTHKTNDIVKNYDIDEALALVLKALDDFHAASLFTMDQDLILDLDKNTLLTQKPSTITPPSTDHDRQKKRLIASENKPFLHALGVTDAQGNVLKSSQDKYRQINKYVEILAGLIKNIPAEKLNHVVDMGAGKGYLTFALYDYLSGLDYKTKVTGVEYRQDMVDLCNDIAKKSSFDGLSFAQGTIEDYNAKDANILIALHACDTATDDAIGKGIAAEAELIVVAPCCHKQIRREIENGRHSNDLDFLTKHGIFLEREAEMVTDALRGLILEYFGYSVKIFEFISDAHTPKNVLIVGIKNLKAPKHPQAVLDKINAAKAYFGITAHHLEKATGL